MRPGKADLLFLLASLAGVGGIVASLRGTGTMLYVAFGLLGVGAALVAAAIVVDRVRTGTGSSPQQGYQGKTNTTSQEDTAKAGHTRP